MKIGNMEVLETCKARLLEDGPSADQDHMADYLERKNFATKECVMDPTALPLANGKSGSHRVHNTAHIPFK